jgi:predicted TIM-barrel fold metal-dependent hydrolase
MTVDFRASSEVADIRGHVGHPIIDADGHQMEFLPLVREFLGEVDREMLPRFDAVDALSTPIRMRGTGGPFWQYPSENTLDRMSTTLPGLLHERMGELGLDFSLVYPTHGLFCTMMEDSALRPALARAFNQYYAENFGPYRDRLEPVAVIPTFTPEEAIAELEYVVGTLGLKAVVMGAVIPRPPRPNRPDRPWLDTLGHDSLYDYDPLWAKCVELGVVPAFHAVGYGWGTRASTKNYMFNHLGNFAAAQEAACRSLFMGGVTKRFPELRLAFLEGGASWGCQLYVDLLGHYEKRNKEAIGHLDPARLDVDGCSKLFEEFASGRLATMQERFVELANQQKTGRDDPSSIDEWEESGIEGPDDVTEIFHEQLFFGCEADDPMNAVAFTPGLLPRQARINAMFASDIGHWDVTDMRGVLGEAWEMVEHGHLNEDDFRDFTCSNVVRMLTSANPSFFDGTAVSEAVRPYIPGSNGRSATR